MNESKPLDEALALALQLAPGERLRLVERVVASVEREISGSIPPDRPDTEHWGQTLNQLLDSLDTSDWEALEMDDLVAWVKQQRAEERELSPHGRYRGVGLGV
jgi:hypothetical protein